MHDFNALLMRERFVLSKKNSSDTDEAMRALGNRLEFECYDSTGNAKAKFVVRAQNVHTCLRIGGRIARQWFDYGHIKDSGRGKFNWAREYKETVQDFEERWNPDCWACVYSNGKIIFESESPEKHQLFDIIEKISALEKGSYRDIVRTAEEIFSKSAKNVKVSYDCDMAMLLNGNKMKAKNDITYRDNDGRNKLDIHIKQKELKVVKGEGTAVRLSECMSVAAVIFEGYQLGFIIGKTNYLLSKGKVSLGDSDAVQTDQAVARIQRLDKALDDMTQKYQLSFSPRPDFRKNIESVEESFKKKGI